MDLGCKAEFLTSSLGLEGIRFPAWIVIRRFMGFKAPSHKSPDP